MAEDITVKVVAETKGLQDKINSSSLADKDKSLLTAKLSEALNLLGKGAHASSKDLGIASKNIKIIIDELVKASAGAKGVSKELIAAQNALEKATQERDKLLKERSNIKRTKISDNGQLRISEANRLAEEAKVTSKQGKEIKSYDALVNAANRGNETAKVALENITRTFEGYQARLEELNNIAIPNADKNVQSATESLNSVHENSLSVAIQQFGNQLQSLVSQLKTHNANQTSNPYDEGVNPKNDLDKINTKVQTSSTSLGKAFKQFSLYAIALRTLKQAARETISTIKELDKSLTEQAMVTGKTREQTYQLLSSYQQLAAQTGSTTREIADLATQFMRQGKTTQESLVLTEAAMSAAKVAGISASESINYLTTALNGFQLSANDAMSVSDKFAAIAANAATSYDEIAIALSKVASQANLAGMSIDYTTALLAKGLETTREAPETIGTALKTIIARMRELSDYGETLGGDTDINNVESQLAYVGIALRDNNGELRSTEEVLDELGRKWNTLNSNQQAAVAKALAGTRQQSRLIAMMSDYERVIELQQIAERSSGATLSQMATYLEGMDAALNRVSIAWESIITSIADNQVIINLINFIASFLSDLGNFLSTDFGTIALLSTIATIVLSTVNTKILEIKLSREQQKYDIEKQKNELISNNLLAKEYIQQNKTRILKEVNFLISQKNLITELQTAKVKRKLTEAEEEQLKAAQEYVTKNEAKIMQEKQNLANAELTTKTFNDQMSLLNSQGSILTTITSAFSSILSIASVLFGVYKWMAMVAGVIVKLKDEEYRKTLRNTIADKKQAAVNKIKAAFSMADSAAKTPPAGWIIAGAILATLAGITIAAAVSTHKYGDSADEAADSINALSNSIYKFETKARAIDTVISSYDELDKKLIKTNADQEEMNKLLDQAADKLDNEQKAAYDALKTNEDRLNYLKAIQVQSEEESSKLRREQINIISNSSGSTRAQLLDENATDSEVLTAQAAIYANNNYELYKYIDSLENAKDGVEKLAQALLNKLTPAQALAFAQQPELIAQLTDSLNSLSTTYTSLSDSTVTGTAAEVLTSDNYSIIDKINAYKEALASLDSEMAQVLQTTYSDIAIFAEFDQTVIDFISKKNFTADGINNINSAIRKLGYDATQSADMIQLLFSTINSGLSIQDSIYSVFGKGLSDQDYNSILKAYSESIGTGVLNMGQNIQTLKNSINSFYETAMKWNDLTDSEKTSFMVDNAELFKGQAGAKLLQAIESQDYNLIYAALADDEGTLYKKVQQQIKDIDEEIQLEYAKLEKDRDYAYIKYLEDQKKVLTDSENLYAASLDNRLEQEQKYLSEYKSYLEDQKEALTESLDKRKEAYSDYFETVNQNAETEDFQNQEKTLIANISKLSTSNSADAINQTAQLEQQLKDLEKERLQTLRQQAQDNLMTSIEDEVSQINEKFDKLLNSQTALLAAMTQDLSDPTSFLSNIISNKATQEGLTATGLLSYIKDIQSIYSPLIGNDVLKNISVREEGNSLILNVNGEEINLSNTDQQSIYEAIMAALKQVGLK